MLDFPYIARPVQKWAAIQGRGEDVKRELQIENHVIKQRNPEISHFIRHDFAISVQLTIIRWYHYYDLYYFDLQLYVYMCHPLPR